MRDTRSRRVPVLYAAQDLGCALGETVFHDLADDPAEPAEAFRADLLASGAATIAVTVAVELADLTDSALTTYGYLRDEVVDTGADSYAVTRLWGQHAWQTTRCAGLVRNAAGARSPGPGQVGQPPRRHTAS